MNIIVAVFSDWGIGCSGTQQIVLQEDRQYFKEVTNGGVVIYGRRTFEDFNKPLPNRRNIILTGDRNFSVDGATIVHSPAEVFAEIAGEDQNKVFIIGGESVYRMFLPACKFAYVTTIYAAPESDTFLPNLDELRNWTLANRGEVHESGGIKYSFDLYQNNAVEEVHV